MDENKKVREKLIFPQNNLVVTSIDIQSVEPVDQRTRDSLQKSVQLAIEITTNSQEATARLFCSYDSYATSMHKKLGNWFVLCCHAWMKVVMIEKLCN